MGDFKLVPGKAYLLKVSIWAAPHDATGMTSNTRIPTGTVFISWPYLDDPKASRNIATDKRANKDGDRYDFAIWNETLPAGCRRFYRVLAEHLEAASSEIVS
jgi:hypothetical protein